MALLRGWDWSKLEGDKKIRNFKSEFKFWMVIPGRLAGIYCESVIDSRVSAQ